MSKKNDKSDANVTNEPTVVDPTSADVPKGEAVADAPAKRTTVVDALFDLGIGWATAALELATAALETTAKALADTAKTLETLAESLGPKKQA
jgi:hypothetical protein